MKSAAIILIVFATATSVLAQKEFPDMGGFNQILDVSGFRGAQFKVSTFAKADTRGVNFSVARFFVSVSEAGSAGLNRYEIIRSAGWTNYSIEGLLGEKSDQLVFGGYYTGTGDYYYDRFVVEIRMPGGEWKTLQIGNPGFEDLSLDNPAPDSPHFGKWVFADRNGFQRAISYDAYEGRQCVRIDGRAKTQNGHFADVNGIRMYYEFHGRGADTILFLHGNGQSMKSFNKQIPVFAKHFTVLTLDSRAQSYTSDDGRALTYELMADDVHRLLIQLGIKRVNILGWSDGGNIGLIMAMKNPDQVKRLAVMGANLFPDSTAIDIQFIRQIRMAQKKLVSEQRLQTDYELRMSHLLLNQPNIHQAELTKIVCKTLVMAGSNDIIKEAHTRLIASHTNQSGLVIFKKGTHFEPERNPERFNRRVLSFFEEN